MNPDTKTDLPVLSISQATATIKQLLEARFTTLMLQGEISNFKRQSSGHLYFSLKDPHAQISAVMFRSNACRLNPLPKEGDQVIVKGALTVYEPRGAYQIVVKELYYVGLGALLLQLERLKQKLKAQGWFEPARKKPLPRFPKTIGIVTSPTGAAIQDILNILSRRHTGFHLILNPVRVQGNGAAQEIADAIRQFNAYNLADVLIVGRGGGSIEDLFAFNDEKVATAIYESRIPIISAVGHETDQCIADFVADIRAPTPSAAAEIALGEKAAQLRFLTDAKKRMQATLSYLIDRARAHMQGLVRHPLFSSSAALLARPYQLLDDKKLEIDGTMHQALSQKRLKLTALISQMHVYSPKAQLTALRDKVGVCKKNSLSAIFCILEQKKQLFAAKDYFRQMHLLFSHRLARYKERLEALSAHLIAVDPRQLMKKGYTILFSEKDASLIISTHQLHENQEIRAYLSDGQARLVVKEVPTPCHKTS